MSCCDDCANKSNSQVPRTVVIDFSSADMAKEELKGDNFAVVGWLFRRLAGDVCVDGDRYVKITNTGSNWLVSIFVRRLPFDELEATLQFNPRTGECATKAYTLLPYGTLELELSVEVPPEVMWSRIGSGMYRLRSYAGAVAVLENIDWLKKRQGKVLLESVKQNDHPDKWPMFLILDGGDEFVLRTAPVIEIPEWRNDQAWQ